MMKINLLCSVYAWEGYTLLKTVINFWKKWFGVHKLDFVQLWTLFVRLDQEKESNDNDDT